MIDPTKVQEITKDLDKYGALDVLAHTEGGILLIDSLSKDVVATINSLAANYRNYTQEQFISACAAIAANLDLLKILTRAEKNKDLAKQALEDALKE